MRYAMVVVLDVKDGDGFEEETAHDFVSDMLSRSNLRDAPAVWYVGDPCEAPEAADYATEGITLQADGWTHTVAPNRLLA
jgi:hypothetical protein